MMMDVMIDLETLATVPDAIVVSIGAIAFDIENGVLGQTFYMAPSVSEQIENGRRLDPDTLKWWMNQSDAAKRVFNEKSKPVANVLTTMTQWYKSIPAETKKIQVWGNGSSFDISIMEHIFRQLNIGIPWGYSKVMDLRTFKRFVAKGVDVRKGGTNHNALDDAKSQAQYVIDQYRVYKEVERLAEQQVQARQAMKEAP